MVLLSTSAVSPSVADGLVFTPGQTLGDSSIVKSNLMGTSFNDAGLVLDTTYFYHLYSRGENLTYSVSVSTSVFLDLHLRWRRPAWRVPCRSTAARSP